MRTDKHSTAIIWVILGVVARVIPHPANVSPLTSISLFGGSHLPARLGALVTLSALVLSDIALALWNSHSVFGWWSLFTYTGFGFVVLVGQTFHKKPSLVRTPVLLVTSSFMFWVWTNFGTWLTSGLYEKSYSGLTACYLAALPFLQNSLLGDILWGTAFFVSFYGIKVASPKFGLRILGA